MRPFTLLLQKKGLRFSSEDAQQIIQSEHLPHHFRLREEGKVLLTLPVIDNTDVSAIAVYNAKDKEEIRTWTDSDPAVQKGIFVYELFQCMGMKGDFLS